MEMSVIKVDRDTLSRISNAFAQKMAGLEAEIHELFGAYGKVHQATVITDKRTGRSKGFGFVDMPQRSARRAIEALHGSEYDGRDLTVRFAQPRTYGG